MGFDCGEEIRDEDKFQVRSQPQMGNDERNSDVEEANASDDTDSPSSVRRQYEPDWVPGSRYFQKLRAENNSQEVAYQLRTRQRCGSGPEELKRKNLQGNWTISILKETKTS